MRRTKSWFRFIWKIRAGEIKKLCTLEVFFFLKTLDETKVLWRFVPHTFGQRLNCKDRKPIGLHYDDDSWQIAGTEHDELLLSPSALKGLFSVEWLSNEIDKDIIPTMAFKLW